MSILLLTDLLIERTMSARGRVLVGKVRCPERVVFHTTYLVSWVALARSARSRPGGRGFGILGARGLRVSVYQRQVVSVVVVVVLVVVVVVVVVICVVVLASLSLSLSGTVFPARVRARIRVSFRAVWLYLTRPRAHVVYVCPRRLLSFMGGWCRSRWRRAPGRQPGLGSRGGARGRWGRSRVYG